MKRRDFLRVAAAGAAVHVGAASAATGAPPSKPSHAAQAIQRCINPRCAAEFAVERVLVSCPKCGSLLDQFSESECRNYFRHCGYRYT